VKRSCIAMSLTQSQPLSKTACQTDESGAGLLLCRASNSATHKRQRPADPNLPPRFVFLSCIPQTGLAVADVVRIAGAAPGRALHPIKRLVLS